MSVPGYPDDIFARVLWGEARGEGREGIEAVAAVVMNRCAVAALYFADHARPHPLFGDGHPETCVTAPWQFSCLNPKDPNRGKLFSVDASDPAFALCAQVAGEAETGNVGDPTGGALYYKTTELPWPASWGPEVPPTAVIGRQSFYVLKR